MTSAFVSAFVLAFSTFLPVINPFSGAMFFCTLTTSLSDRDRAFVANRIALYCLIILLVCLTCGHLILSFFGIFAAGWTALNAPTQEETTEERPALSRAKLKSMAFYPFTLPLTTGPGAIAVSVAVSTSLPRDLGHIAGTFVATVATVAVIWVCYRYSDRLNKAVGVAGADALARIFAFILICLGVAIFWQGFSELWLELSAQATAAAAAVK